MTVCVAPAPGGAAPEAEVATGPAPADPVAVQDPAHAAQPTESPQICELVVGFVDLTGSTALAARVPTPDYARAMVRFRSIATATVDRRGGRLVKVIGDGALFLASDAPTGAAVAFALIAACADHPELPALRGGLAQGEVVLDGDDCFGLAVNLAAKSAALARPGSVVATRSVIDGLGDGAGCPPGQALPGGRLFDLPAFVELFELDGPDGLEASRTTA